MNMCTQLFAITLPIMLMLTANLVNCRIDPRYSFGAEHSASAKLLKIRCTRRFSPGVCVEDVEPVWTFVFLQQNCTERLGCPNNYRSNRFRSYRMCMKQCRGLVDMYLKMVEYEEKNVDQNNYTLEGDMRSTNYIDHNLREGFGKYNATANETKELPGYLDDFSQDLEEEEYEEEKPDSRFIEYKESNVYEDIIPADIDYVPGVIRSDIEWVRW